MRTAGSGRRSGSSPSSRCSAIRCATSSTARWAVRSRSRRSCGTGCHDAVADPRVPLGGGGERHRDVPFQAEPLARGLRAHRGGHSASGLRDLRERALDRPHRALRGGVDPALAGALPVLRAEAEPRARAPDRRMTGLPSVRGRLTATRPLADLTWMRVGGPADWLFQPADADDLAGFLAALDPAVPVFPMGVGSNLIVRDGGIRGVVIRLGRGFNGIAVEGGRVTAGAAALDAHVAKRAAEAGLDLTFLRTIPGSIGGAVRMNAGCYGTYTADRFVSARAVSRDGQIVTLSADDLNFSYRHTDLPEGWVLVEATFDAPADDPAALLARMDDQLTKRDATQPTKDRSAGSTFRNPAGFSSTGRADDVHDLKAWKVIDDAGMRGARVGGAQMSEKHSNFLINTGDATAQDLETLGEEVRKRVFQNSGIELHWEIMRVGEPTP